MTLCRTCKSILINTFYFPQFFLIPEFSSWILPDSPSDLAQLIDNKFSSFKVLISIELIPDVDWEILFIFLENLAIKMFFSRPPLFIFTDRHSNLCSAINNCSARLTLKRFSKNSNPWRKAKGERILTPICKRKSKSKSVFYSSRRHFCRFETYFIWESIIHI